MKKIILLLALLVGFAGMAHAETVIYNPNSKIFHNPTCQSAKICKVCIKIEKQIAIQKGGRACKKCGG